MRVKTISRFYYRAEGRYVDPPEVLELPDEDAQRLIEAQCVVPAPAPKRKAHRPKLDKARKGGEENK